MTGSHEKWKRLNEKKEKKSQKLWKILNCNILWQVWCDQSWTAASFPTTTTCPLSDSPCKPSKSQKIKSKQRNQRKSMSKQRKSPPKYVEKPEKSILKPSKSQNQDQNQNVVLESVSDQPNQTKRVKWKKTKSPWAASASSSEWRSSWWSWASTWRPALDLPDNDKEETDHKPGAALAAAPCLVHLSWGHLCQVACSLWEKYWHSFPFEAGQLVGLLQLLLGEGENQARALKSMLSAYSFSEGCFEVGF